MEINPVNKKEEITRKPITKSKLNSQKRLIRKPFSVFFSFSFISNISFTNWTIFLIIKKPRKRKMTIPIIPTSFNFDEISLAFSNISGETFEKKSGENGYILFKTILGSPRSFVNKNVKNVNKNRVENIE